MVCFEDSAYSAAGIGSATAYRMEEHGALAAASFAAAENARGETFIAQVSDRRRQGEATVPALDSGWYPDEGD